MSSVLARKRGISEMEFYRCAMELRIVLIRALMNDNIVPKRWKPIFTFPIIERLNKLLKHISKANSIYPYNEAELQRRKDLQKKAINDCDLIDDQLQCLLEVLYYGKIDADHPMPYALEQAGTLIDRTDMLLREWRKKAKIVNYKKHE